MQQRKQPLLVMIVERWQDYLQQMMFWKAADLSMRYWSWYALSPGINVTDCYINVVFFPGRCLKEYITLILIVSEIPGWDC